MHLSRFKVYKEHIRDLLAQSAAAPPVRMFDSTDGLVIRGLREEVVTSPEQVFAILAQGEARRQVGATHANLHSSRSHVMVRIWIESSGTSVGGFGGVRIGQVEWE
jgi:centromeric protein E